MQLFQIGITTEGRFNDSNTLVSSVVGEVLVWAIILVGFYFLVRILLVGFTYLTSFGESAKIQSAQKELQNALIGLIIVISVYFIGQLLQIAFGLNLFLNATP